MSSLLWVLMAIAAILAAALLVRNLSARFTADGLRRFNDRRRGSCRMVSRGEFINGSRHIPVAMAVSERTFYYENQDMSGSLDLEWVQEVEYENELSTGQQVAHGTVLRLRCFSQGFEFILPNDVVAGWQAILPSHRMATS